MGLKDRFKALVGLGSGGGSGKGKVLLRVAKLPSRIFVDGSMALQGLAVEGLYGMARLTVHEAELWLAPAPAAGSADAVAHPYNTRAKYYAVVSLGRQTFASRRVRAAAGGGSSSGGGGGGGDGGAARFLWDAGAAVVLQRSGATVAQLAIYRAGRVDGALGDKLQCWCQLDLAGYFGGASEEEEAAAGEAGGGGSPEAAPGGEPPAPPPALLRTEALGSGDSSATLHSSSGGTAEPEAGASHAAPRGDGGEQPGGGASQAAAPREAAASEAGGGAGEAVLQDVWLPLVDPGDAALVRGRVRVSVRAVSPAGLECQLWRRLLPLADLDGDGSLTEEEFAGLMEAMGAELSPQEVVALFRQADANSDGTVDAQELAAALAACHKEGEFHRLMRRCPVDGAQLLPNDDLANIIYVTLALDEGTGESLKGGYTTPQQVSRSWLLSMTEWATQPLLGSTAALWRGNEYRAGGLRQGAAAAHILVFDRATKRVVEEAVSPGLMLAMRAMYQTSEGALLLREGTCRKLKQMSEKYGARADSPESAADIPKFLAAFRGQIDMKEYVQTDPAAYHCFNDFFYRKIKPEARPIAGADDPAVIVSAADCRLTVFNSVDDATRCWIKGKKFSLAGMLGDAGAAAAASPDGGADGGADAVDPRAVAPAPESEAEAEKQPSDPSGGFIAGSSSKGSVGGSSKDAGGGGGGGGGGDGGGCVCTAADFRGGSMAIFRLAPQDYHRFHLPVSGRVESITDIPGELLTVNPIAVNSRFADVFTRNKRSVLCLRAPGYGLVAYVAVGATVVGSIRWTVEVGQEVAKGAEAGYFAFGGSTCVVLFQEGAAVWDADLAKNSLKSLETRVLMGERLGVRGSGGGDGSKL